MTISELRNDAHFLAFCHHWAKEGRCPLAAVDYLIEQGLPAEAEALRYAASETREYICVEQMGFGTTSGLYPCRGCYVRGVFVWHGPEVTKETESCYVPDDVIGRFRGNSAHLFPRSVHFDTFPDAIGNWVEAWVEAWVAAHALSGASS